MILVNNVIIKPAANNYDIVVAFVVKMSKTVF